MNPNRRPLTAVIGRDRLPPQCWLRFATAGFLLLSLKHVQAATGPPPKAEKSGKPDRVLIVRVTSGNQPVEGAEVAPFDTGAILASHTDRDGEAHLPLPADGKVNAVIAIHPSLGSRVRISRLWPSKCGRWRGDVLAGVIAAWLGSFVRTPGESATRGCTVCGAGKG